MGPINSHASWVPHWLRALHSSARYAATASVRGLLVAGIQVFVPYRIHPSIHPDKAGSKLTQEISPRLPAHEHAPTYRETPGRGGRRGRGVRNAHERGRYAW